jgi:hypothetical protein
MENPISSNRRTKLFELNANMILENKKKIKNRNSEILK